MSKLYLYAIKKYTILTWKELHMTANQTKLHDVHETITHNGVGLYTLYCLCLNVRGKIHHAMLLTVLRLVEK